MTLTCESPYLFFPNFDFELNDFTIITGLNGSGKTQLLRAIENKDGTTPIKIFHKGKQHRGIRYIPTNSFFPTTNLSYNGNASTSVESPIEQVIRHFKALKEYFNDHYPNDIDPETRLSIRQRDPRDFAIVGEQYLTLAQNLNKSFFDLTELDIRSDYKIAWGIPSNDMLFFNIGQLVGDYITKYDENDYAKYRVTMANDTSFAFLSEEHFVEKYGPNPINKINTIFERNDFHFRLRAKILQKNVVEAFLEDKNTGLTIPFDQLSTGEKIILSIIFVIYNNTIGSPIKRLLLLDEPEASLHPSRVKKFLDTLNEVFIKEMGMRIIMTSHSPSTIALAPENVDFVLLEKNPFLIKNLSRDEALNKLSEGVPTLSVRIENRRIVFVESSQDAEIYSELFLKYRSRLNTSYSLDFIPPDISGNADCNKVVDILEKLYPMPYVFGLIDYDGRNKETNSLKVLGLNTRDGLESFILDPLLIGVLLVRDFPAEYLIKFGFSADESYMSIPSFDFNKIQSLVNNILNSIYYTATSADESELVDSTYLNNVTVLIPKWYCTMDDHDLEDLLLKSFPQLNSYRGKHKVKIAVVKKVLNDMPQLIPIELYRTFERLLS